MNDVEVLENVYIVPNAKANKRCVFISAKSVNSPPFLFYSLHQVSHSVEYALENIMANKHEKLYVVVDFRDCHLSIPYLSILEDDQSYVNEKDLEHIDAFLNHSLHLFEVEAIKKQIDLSLDERNKKRFLSLTKRLHALKKIDS